MKLRSLYWKFILAFGLIAFITAALVALFVRLTNADRLSQFIVEQQRSILEQSLSSYYLQNGSWQDIASNWQQIQYQSFPTPAITPSSQNSPGNPPPGGFGRGNMMGLADAQGIVLVSVDPNNPDGSSLPAEALKTGYPIRINGEVVGTILTARQPPNLNPQETLFLQRTDQALIYAMLAALLVALILGFLLARTLTHPLRALTQAAQSITQGQLEQQVNVSSNDEIGQLASAFNQMSEEVARVNQLRKQMTADIAHDLRTPLTVISGYIESMRDGVLAPTPQRLALIYSEIERLQNLVGDLRMLSLADAGELVLNPQSIQPIALLNRAATLFRHQAEGQNIEICVEASSDLPDIRVDEARMMQVFGNLISNALRYTPAGGEVHLNAQVTDNQVEICVRDTGSGISAEELPLIFNRFHRTDRSRHSESGETGLGLAIVKSIVELHDGSISAESTIGAGTIVHMRFPLD